MKPFWGWNLSPITFISPVVQQLICRQNQVPACLHDGADDCMWNREDLKSGILALAFGRRHWLLHLLRCGYPTFFKFSGPENQQGGFLRWVAFGVGPGLGSLKYPINLLPLILCVLAKAVDWGEARRRENFSQKGNVVLMPSDPSLCTPPTTDPTDVAKPQNTKVSMLQRDRRHEIIRQRKAGSLLQLEWCNFPNTTSFTWTFKKKKKQQEMQGGQLQF